LGYCGEKLVNQLAADSIIFLEFTGRVCPTRSLGGAKSIVTLSFATLKVEQLTTLGPQRPKIFRWIMAR
ncbi:hypothetical protein JTE90_015946, partial [Oedothorax gibbosus]